MSKFVKVMFVAVAVFSLTAVPGMITDAQAKTMGGKKSK